MKTLFSFVTGNTCATRTWLNAPVCGMVLCLVFPFGIAAAQQMGANSGDGQQSQTDVFQLMSRLKKSIGDDELKGSDNSAGNADRWAPGPARPGSVLPLANTGIPDGDSLRNKLELLRSVMNQKTEGEQFPGTTEAQAIPPTPVAEKAPVNLAGPESANSVPFSDLSQPTPVPDDAQTFLVDESLIRSPVDAMELAGSLFATGNFQLALKTWRSVDNQIVDPHERQWLDYFVGSSLRITGSREEAEAVYRDLLKTGQTGYPVTSAKQWIDWIEKRKRSDELARQVIGGIELIEKELNKDGN